MADWKLKITDIGEFEFKVENKNTPCLGGDSTLISLNIEKEMYASGHIEAVIEIKPSGHTFGMISYDSLLNKTASLEDNNDKLVAKDYVVFDCSVEDVPSGSKTSRYLTLGIYSPEHRFTFKKSKKCYVVKKLAADIFESIASDQENDKKNPINHSYSNLKQLVNSTDSKEHRVEFIQPYLVQYEETTLDFLARTANECGEFMFFEDGNWFLGAREGSKTTLENYVSVTYKKVTSNEEADDAVVVGTKEEYLETLTKSENTSTVGESLAKRMGVTNVTGWLFNFGNWLKKNNVAEFATSFAADMALNTGKVFLKSNDQINQWNKTFITPFEKNVEQYGTVNGKQVVCQFSNFDAKSKFGKKFYEDIRKAEKKASKNKIHINFGTQYQTILLGDEINYNGTNYTVCNISYSCKYKDSKPEHISYEIDAIPEIDKKFYPPLLERKATNKIENQMVIVTANNDPSNLGRIQIRYPWQDASESPSSPWINIAQPFLSDKAGFRFTPQVGDNIIIGYEHGRIDRPFMVGGVATKKRNLDPNVNKVGMIENGVSNCYISQNSYFNNDFMIKSPSGQYIKFITPSNANFTNFVTSFFPAINTGLGFLPAQLDAITYAADQGVGKEFGGGINIGDAYGFFNINMSTEKRRVLISSALGNVQIDAFTGITISAPNGNVKIEGKNVEIVAGNNLTLKSGENVDKMVKAYAKGKNTNIGKTAALNTLKDQVNKFTKLVDLTLLRTILDGIVKPVGGTMLIKSKRFMRLEAGSGTTALPKEAYEKDSDAERKVLNARIDEMKAKHVLESTIKLIDKYTKAFNDRSAMFTALKVVYERKTKLFLKAVKKNEEVKVTWDNKDCYSNDIDIEKIDKLEDIVKAVKAGKSAEEVFPKLSKFKFNHSFKGLGDIQSRYSALTKAAEAIADECDAYFDDLDEISKNKYAFLQIEVIPEPDSASELADGIGYGNLIYRYLSYTENEIAADGGVGEPDDQAFEGKDTDPTGIRLAIYQKLPEELTELKGFGTVADFDISPVEKRKILWKAIQILQKSKLVSVNFDDFLCSLTNPVANNESLCEDVDTWKKYLGFVKPYTAEKGKLMKFLEFTNYLGAKDIVDLCKNWETESVLYDPSVQGEILLSDTSGNTCKINGQQIKTEPVSELKAEMDVLKKI